MAAAFVFAEGLASLWLSLAIAFRGGMLKDDAVPMARNDGIFAIFILSGICFAQREHTAKTQTLWLMASVRYLLDKGRGDPQKMRDYIDMDARMFADNVRAEKPDMILSTTGPHEKKIWKNPHIAAAMKSYRLADTVSGV